MKGLILKNAYMSFEEYDSQAMRLKQELENLGVPTDIIRNRFYPVCVGGEVFTNLKNYDFCIYLDKDKYVLKGLQKCGIRTFNSYNAIELCDDKMLTFLELSNHNVPLPLTIPAPLCYDESIEIDESAIDNLEQKLGYPVVVKLCYGSRGAGVFLAKDRRELIKYCNEFKCRPHLYQKFIKESFGRDLRVIVVGGKVLGGMLRQSNGDFRSNVALGGNTKPYNIDSQTAELCVKTADILGLDYCGIDLLLSENGQKYVCEVNSNAFFHGFEKTTNINVAKAYAQHIIEQMSKK
ncbi:MAG: RimK family alpha-L-glutamate ligase [Candidatus Coproplasma sp.]